jgi:hypothetical protein
MLLLTCSACFQAVVEGPPVPAVPPADAGAPATTIPDSGLDAGGPEDAGSPDAASPDAGLDAGEPADGGSSDAGARDAGVDAGGVGDGGASDAGQSDAGQADAGASSCWPHPTFTHRVVRPPARYVWGQLSGLGGGTGLWESNDGQIVTELERFPDGGSLKPDDTCMAELDDGGVVESDPRWYVGHSLLLRRPWGFRSLGASGPGISAWRFARRDIAFEGGSLPGPACRVVAVADAPMPINYTSSRHLHSTDGITYWLAVNEETVVWWRPLTDEAGFVPCSRPRGFGPVSGSTVAVMTALEDGGTLLGELVTDGGWTPRTAFPFGVWPCVSSQRDLWCSSTGDRLVRAQLDGGFSVVRDGGFTLKAIGYPSEFVIADPWHGGEALLLHDRWAAPHPIFVKPPGELLGVGMRRDGGLVIGYWEQDGGSLTSPQDLPPLVYGDLCPPSR